MIDVGGPSMLRGAAKNFAHVAPVCRPERYDFVLAELQERGDLSGETRRALAAEAFATTASYEAAIARWFADIEAFPETLVTAFTKVMDLRYGENPHQRPPTTPSRARGCISCHASSTCTGRSSR